MCFVIAGMQPKTRILDERPQRCPQCGLHQAYTQRVDHYLSLFFIPLIRVKTGEPFVYCRRCQLAVGANPLGGDADPQWNSKPMCRRCGRTIQSDFDYCPYCGQRQ